MLAHVRDPGNAGTVLRCADAAGADAVVLTDASVDLYNPKAVRASVGSPLPPAGRRRASPSSRPSPGCGPRAYGSWPPTARASDDLDDELDEGTMGGPTAWIFGNEAWGLPEETRALADEVVRVPIHGEAESLNLATAAAVCLYASARAQRAPGGCRSVTSQLVGWLPGALRGVAHMGVMSREDARIARTIRPSASQQPPATAPRPVPVRPS